MKKTYINPQTTFVHVETTGMMALSIVEGTAKQDGTVLVKEDKTNSSASYNVWDDDWSK